MSAWTLRQYTMKLSYQLFLLFALNTLGHLNISFSIMRCTYGKVTSSRPSQLVAHFQIFRRLMKGKTDAYGLCVTFGQKVPKFNSRPVYCSRFSGNTTKIIAEQLLKLWCPTLCIIYPNLYNLTSFIIIYCRVTSINVSLWLGNQLFPKRSQVHKHQVCPS